MSEGDAHGVGSLPSGRLAYPSPGDVIDNKYRVERFIGRGGMGAVVEATHLGRRASVALKFLSPDMAGVPGAAERFVNEAVAASKIKSSHVVSIHDVCRLPDGSPYLVMELLSGHDIEAELESAGGRGLPVARALHLVLQILRGLQIAHAAGVVHRDLKPSNAFVVEQDGEEDFVKLLDFGISKVLAPGELTSLTQTNVGLGTPLYMSPEQARDAHSADARSDVYSVGAMLFELLSGRTPFVAATANDLLFQLFTRQPDSVVKFAPHVPEGLAAAVDAALAPDPAARPPSAAAFAELLAPYAAEQSSHVLYRLRASAGGRLSHSPPTSEISSAAVAARESGRGLGSIPLPPPVAKISYPMARLRGAGDDRGRDSSQPHAVAATMVSLRPAARASFGLVAAALVLGVGVTIGLVAKSRPSPAASPVSAPVAGAMVPPAVSIVASKLEASELEAPALASASSSAATSASSVSPPVKRAGSPAGKRNAYDYKPLQ